MTDKERLQLILDNTQVDHIEVILSLFLNRFEDDLSIDTINSLHNEICFVLDKKIKRAEQALFVANERAGYLKRYLDGSMWKDERIARENLQPQIENAQAIIDECRKAK